MRVALFIPCLTDQFFPETGMNMVRILDRLGIESVYDDRQTCCGQPAFNTGYHTEARVLAERFIEIFTGADYVVCPSGSCTTMAKVFYGDLLDISAKSRDNLDRLRSRLFEFTQFIVDVVGCTDVGAEFHGRVTLHDSCHALRELGIKEQPRKLLHAVKGLELVEMDDSERCCGFGGTFSVKHAELSTEMARAKVASIERADVDFVTGVDSSCLMQISGLMSRKGIRTRALHIADILASTGKG